jgi:hypothetical protein
MMTMGTGWLGTNDGANRLARFLFPAQVINRLLAWGGCPLVCLGLPHVEVVGTHGGAS